MNSKALSLTLAIWLPAAAAWADSVVVSQVLGPSGIEGLPTRTVPPYHGDFTNPPLANGGVYQYKVTTDGDILSVNNIKITFLSSPGGPLWNHMAGDAQNSNKPNPILLPAFWTLMDDTWIDTPGDGSRLGPDLPGDGTTTIGDLSDDGPVTDFLFAQLTVPEGHQFRFEGRISIAGTGGTHVFTQPFNFTTIIPEPSAALLAACALPVLIASRRSRRRSEFYCLRKRLMNKKTLPLAIAPIFLSIASACADSVLIGRVLGPSGRFGRPTRAVTVAESSASVVPAPLNGDVWQFTVTTDGDILSVNNIQITHQGGVALYQHPAGDVQDANGPRDIFLPAFPSLSADSWIDTPGAGNRLGPPLPGDGTTTVGDTTDDGPVTDYVFAQLTFPKDTLFTISGRISIAGQHPGAVFDQPFHFTAFFPEPTSVWLAVCALPVLADQRRVRRRDRS
jgi:hypothetical protein